MGHLDFHQAFRMHPFGVLLFVFWGWSALKDAVWLIWKKSIPFPPPGIWKISKKWFLIGMLIYGVIRMLILLPEFAPLHPLLKSMDYIHQRFILSLAMGLQV